MAIGHREGEEVKGEREAIRGALLLSRMADHESFGRFGHGRELSAGTAEGGQSGGR